jgi:hypothetical protein
MLTSKPCCTLVLLLTLPIACASNDPSSSGPTATVTDTLGFKFRVDCSPGLCYPTSQDGLKPRSCASGVGTEAFVLIPYPVLSIYAVLVSSYGGIQLSAGNPSHPVACSSDLDCMPAGVPANQGTCSFSCNHGLCRTTSSACMPKDGSPLFTDNVLTLCQADISWPSECPYLTTQPFASRIAEVAAACGAQSTCASVPADCRQLEGVATPGIDGGGMAAPEIDGAL